MREVGILEAKTGLSGLVADVERTGEEIILTRHGRAAAKLVPVSKAGRFQTPKDRRQAVEALLKRRDARQVVHGFDDLSWEELKRIGRDEDDHD
jgi:prevent-host-death family protein